MIASRGKDTTPWRLSHRRKTRSAGFARGSFGARSFVPCPWPILRTPSRTPKIAFQEQIATDIWRARVYSDSRRPATITMDKNEPTPVVLRPSEVAISQQKALLRNTGHSRRPGKWFLVDEMCGCGTKWSIERLRWYHTLKLRPFFLRACRAPTCRLGTCALRWFGFLFSLFWISTRPKRAANRRGTVRFFYIARLDRVIRPKNNANRVVIGPCCLSGLLTI